MKKHNLILTAMLAIALCFTACSKSDDNPQPTKLQKLAEETRQSIKDVKAYNTNYWNERFASETSAKMPTNILDSAYSCRNVAATIWNNLGNPLPIPEYQELLKKMNDKCSEYIMIATN